jgi:probable rRNA maturation factor
MAVDVDCRQPGCDPACVPFAALADEVLRAELGGDAQVSVVLTSDAEIAALNAQWLGHEGPTDVISFPQHDLRPGAGAGAVGTLLGDIVISVDSAAAQAADYPGWTLARETALLFVHGLLHLCGYDDQTPTDRAHMQRREDEVLVACGLPPAPRDG